MSEPVSYSTECPVCGYPHDFNTSREAETAARRWNAQIIALVTRATPRPPMTPQPFITDTGAPVREGRPEQRQTHNVLEAVESTLIEILAEMKRANAASREGAVSSVEVKTSTRGVDISCKAYAGSDIESAGNAAAAEYERVRSMIEARLMNGEKP